MAVTAIWSVKGNVETVIRYTANPSKTWNENYEEAASYHALENVISYSADEMKTEKQLYVSGVNCSEIPAVAVDQFHDTKRAHKKEGGIVCFHGYQSFRPGEVTPELAHKIGVELAKRLWGDRFEVLVSSHLNTGVIHNHFCLNSISFVDGLRYYDQKKTYARMREVSDELCREYGLSVIENPGRGSRSIGEIKAEAEGRYTVRGQIRCDIDFAISQNTTQKQFYRTMESLGYIFERRGSFLRIRPDGGMKWFRLDRLGEGYGESDINERLFERWKSGKRSQYRPFMPNPREKPKGLQALYLYYLYLLGELPKTKPNRKVIYEALRDDKRRAHMYSEEAKLLGKYDINTDEDLKRFTEGISNSYEALAINRQKLRNKLRKMNDSEQMMPIKAQIARITDEMAVYRKQMKLCEDIALRSGAIEAVVNKIYESEIQMEKPIERKEQEHEYKRRSR